MAMAGLVMSCQVENQELGEDLLPAGDNVFLYHDTIFDIHAYPVSGDPLVTSDRSGNKSKRYLIGYSEDTIVGSSRASMVTQFNSTRYFRNGPNTDIDSMLLDLYIESFVGDKSEEVTVTIHEFSERIFFDSTYYSDYNAEGKYNPVPLVEKSFIPKDGVIETFVIKDQGFIDKFLAIQADTAYFRNDSLFKDYFKGFYITAESASPKGVMARVVPSSEDTKFSVKYANDSTQNDSLPGREYVWTHFTINEFNCQKINLFEHDHSGTYLSGIIDRDDVESPYIYVQGMSGVNTRLSFTALEEWLLEEPIAVSSASLVFEVVPESESGILLGDQPERLMLYSEIDEGEFEPLYDYLAVYNTNNELFGGILSPESEGLFFDTTYTYRFNVGLHFQAMVTGKAPHNDFSLQLFGGQSSPKYSKLYSNLPANRKRIRLEVVYLKL
jgi:hypothetical protein